MQRAVMNLCGEVVKHKMFGEGKIVKFDNRYITVLFDTEQEKRFVYPTAFGAFLQMQNNTFENQIEIDKAVVAKQEEELKKQEKIRREHEQSVRLALSFNEKNSGKKRTLASKASDKGNIAFKCSYCDGGATDNSLGYKSVCNKDTIKYNVEVAKNAWCKNPESHCFKYINGQLSDDEFSNICSSGDFICYESKMLNEWYAFAGVTQTGKDKGKPMTLKNVKPNNLAMLTTKLQGMSDESRFIFAVFLIDDDYEGENRRIGHVISNPKYRVELSIDEAKELKFWDYYFNPNKPEKMVFGSGLHRYFTDVQSAQVLNKLCEIKSGKEDEEKAKEMFECFCKLKNIDISSLEKPNGALNRNSEKEETEAEQENE